MLPRHLVPSPWVSGRAKAGRVHQVLAARGRRVAGCWNGQTGWLGLPKTDMTYTECGPSGKDSEASGGEAAEDEDEAEEPPDLQPYSGKWGSGRQGSTFLSKPPTLLTAEECTVKTGS